MSLRVNIGSPSPESSPKRYNNNNNDSHDNDRHRVILLLDLDCFYAQCECVRLGLDSQIVPLALMQWNTALAITYPARDLYGIKRGDNWKDIASKSSNECYAVHVALFTSKSNDDNDNTNLDSTNDIVKDESDDDGNNNGNESVLSIKEDYARIYELTDEAKLQARRDELGKRRLSQEGKASIERYRIASARIFQVVREYLESQQLSSKDNPNGGKVILERASIDEFFLDVTKACYADDDDNSQQPTWMNLREKALETTNIIGKDKINVDTSDAALQKGCVLALAIRQAVYDTLGFTLSAGVGVNKTLAKLSASYGKPNGQAVTYLSATDFLLKNTAINKCRNMGGKLGKKVCALLPPDVPTTIYSIQKYLSLPDLKRGLDNNVEVASWVFNLARGDEQEAVVAKNELSLIKSITTYKSLPFDMDGYTIDRITDWIKLLAQEMVHRIEKDTARNHRYPSTCNFCYAPFDDKTWQNKTLRIRMPPERLSTTEKVTELCKQGVKVFTEKVGSAYRLRRIGFSAGDFAERDVKNGIENYFTRNVNNSTSNISGSNVVVVSGDLDKKPGKVNNVPDNSLDLKKDAKVIEKPDLDLELARKLQANYDREVRTFQAMDRKRSRSKQSSTTTVSKTKRIDSFFGKI